MTVADLQQFVRSLGAALAAAGAKKVADELESVGQGFEPFRTLGLAKFSQFLVMAETYARTGVVPTIGKGRSKAAAPKPDSAEVVRSAGERIAVLYERAVDPSVPYTAIEAELKAIEKQLGKDEAVQAARNFGIAAALKTKKAALDAIKRKITERKESFERTRFGGTPAGASTQ